MFKNLVYRIAPFFLKTFLFFIFSTCKWKIYNKEFFISAQKKSRPILICCWHNSFLLVARHFKEISLPIWAVSSTHRDSEIMAKILHGWNFRLIKGSSTRGWSSVLKKMMSLFKNSNNIIAVTNDGPKGPAFIAKKGSVNLGLKSGAQVVAVSGTANKYWTLPSWDKTIIPKPFATISIQFSDVFPNKPDAIINESDAVSEYINTNYISLNNKVHR